MDSVTFGQYLGLAAGVYSALKHVVFDRLAVTDAETVLDVGCGTGTDAAAIQTHLTRGRAYGVDHHLGLLRRASSPVRVAAKGEHLPFRDASFSRCRAERVLQHVEHPLRIVDEMCRVLAPGGRLVLAEPDRRTLVIDGAEPTTEHVIRAAAAGIVSGDVGRRLYGALVARGLREVSVEGVTVTLTRFQDLRDMGLDRAVRYAVDTGVVTAHDAHAWIDDLQRRDACGRCFAAMTVFVVTAVKS